MEITDVTTCVQLNNMGSLLTVLWRRLLQKSMKTISIIKIKNVQI